MVEKLRNDSVRGASLLVIASLIFCPFQPAHAQSAEADQGDRSGATESAEIIVTAQRREQRIQDVGISVSAFSGEALKRFGVQSSIDIARLTPGVSISANGGGQNSQFSIRGVTQNDFSDAIEAPVAVYVDETYIPNLNGQIFGTFDLNRVEVIKGPQGTLFGRNATGGLVHFQPNKPSDDPNGYLDVTYGRYNHVRVEGAIGLPISDNVQVRFSGLYNRFDPIMKNIYPYGVSNLIAGTTPPGPSCCQDIWNDDTVALRGQLQMEPTERLTIRLTGSFARQIMGENPYNSVATIGVYDDQGRLSNVRFAGPDEIRMNIGPNGENVAAGGVPTTATRPTPGGDFYGYRAPSAKSLQVSKDWALDNLVRLKATDAALHVNYDLGNAEFASISNYRTFRKNFGTDIDAGPTNLVDYITASKQESFSQELRVSSTGKTNVRWVSGAYYLWIDANVRSGLTAPSNSVFAGVFGPGFATSGIDLINNIRLKTSSISGFGQVEYDFAPKLTAILGGRIIHEHQNYNFSSFAHQNFNDYQIDDGPSLFELQAPYSNTRSHTLWAGKAQIEYRPSRDMLLYAGVNRGVKGGAYNALLPDGSPSLPPSRIPYGPETLVSYEGGIKSTLLGGLATIDASAYYYDYKDYQAFTFTNISAVVINNDARIYGVEASLNLRPARGLNIGLGVSLLDAKVLGLVTQTGPRDVRPTFTPSQTYAGQISYKLPSEIAGGSVEVTADASWRSKSYTNLRNFDADVIRSYFLANAHIYYTISRIKMGVGVDNIFDKRYRTTTYNLATLCGCNEEAYGAPRWWNVSLRYTY